MRASQVEEVAHLLGNARTLIGFSTYPSKPEANARVAVLVHGEGRDRDDGHVLAVAPSGSGAEPRRRRCRGAAGPSGSGPGPLDLARAGPRPRPWSPRRPRSPSTRARPARASGSSGCPRPRGSGERSRSPPSGRGVSRSRRRTPTAASAASRSSRLTGFTRYAAAPSAAPRARSSTIETTTTGMSRVCRVRLESLAAPPSRRCRAVGCRAARRRVGPAGPPRDRSARRAAVTTCEPPLRTGRPSTGRGRHGRPR